MVHQRIFPLQYAITSILHNPEDDLDAVDMLLSLQALRTSIYWTFFGGYLESQVYETAVDIRNVLPAWIGVAEEDIPSYIGFSVCLSIFTTMLSKARYGSRAQIRTAIVLVSFRLASDTEQCSTD